MIPLFVDSSMQLFKLSQRLLIKNSTSEIAELITTDMQVKWSDLSLLCDFVFIALHGGQGENGCVQGMLEMLRLPYNGSGVLASALCMDKYKTNSLLQAKGFNVPGSVLVEKTLWAVDRVKIVHDIMAKNWNGGSSFPCIVKPVDDGCSVFVSKVNDKDQLELSIDVLLAQGKSAALVEELVQGIELTCGVYGNNDVVVLPPSQAVAQKGVLSIQEKFLPGAGQNVTPAPIGDTALSFAREIIRRCYKAVGCKGYARIDCFYQSPEVSLTGEQRLIILEINSLPALTPATCLFHQAAEIGIKPMDFMDMVVSLGMQQHNKDLTDSGNINIDLTEKNEEVIYCEETIETVDVDNNYLT